MVAAWPNLGDHFAWRTWVAVKTIVQRERRGGESHRNVVALLTPIMSSLVGRAKHHASIPLGEREEKRYGGKLVKATLAQGGGYLSRQVW